MQLIKTETRIVGIPTQKLRAILVPHIPNINEYEIKANDNRVIGYDIPNTVKSSRELAAVVESKASLLASCSLAGIFIQAFHLDSKTIIDITAFSDSTALKARVK